MRTFWKILLGVVVALIVLGVIGFGVARSWMWNGRYAMWDRMPARDRWMQDEYDGEMPCEEEGEVYCEGPGSMPFGGFSGRGMHRTPFMHSMPGMVKTSWWRPGFSPFSWLLLIALIVMGVLFFKQQKELKQYTQRDTVSPAESDQTEEG
jgi:hypothetical protein